MKDFWLTQTLMAQYMAAGMNRSDRNARQQESDDAGKAVDAAKPTTEAPDLGDQVVAKMLAERGKTPKAVSHA